MKKDIKLNKAWIVFVNNEAVHVLNSRKSFDFVLEHAREVYRFRFSSLDEKIQFAHYTKGEKAKRNMFRKTIPVFTDYMSDTYRNLMKYGHEHGLDDEVFQKLREKWKNIQEYVLVGEPNKSVEIRKGFNICVVGAKGVRKICFETSRADGSREIHREEA